MRDVAARLESAAAAMSTVDRLLSSPTVPPSAFGADDEGRPGRLGRQLHDLWSATLAARSREATDTARRLAGLAADVTTTAHAYTETDDDVARRIERSPGRDD